MYLREGGDVCTDSDSSLFLRYWQFFPPSFASYYSDPYTFGWDPNITDHLLIRSLCRNIETRNIFGPEPSAVLPSYVLCPRHYDEFGVPHFISLFPTSLTTFFALVLCVKMPRLSQHFLSRFRGQPRNLIRISHSTPYLFRDRLLPD